MRDDTVKKTQ